MEDKLSCQIARTSFDKVYMMDIRYSSGVDK